MAVIGIDLGATKLALAVFSDEGELLERKEQLIKDRDGGELVRHVVRETVVVCEVASQGVWVWVPGMYDPDAGRVGAPRIPGGDADPLLDVLSGAVGGGVRVRVESDRAGCFLGEVWKGAAQGCTDAVFM